MKVSKMNHNRHSHALDSLKLLFMLLIVIHHSNYFHALSHAYMAVDLFFMISGFLLMHTMIRKPEMNTARYLLSRLSKLYPHYLLSFAAMFLATSAYKDGSITLTKVLYSLPEMLLIQNLGIFSGGVNYPCWYLSVLIFASILIFFLGRVLSRQLFQTISILCACVSYGYILYFTGGSMETFATVGVFYLPFWRGMAGLFCGTLLYQLHGVLPVVFKKYRNGFLCLELVTLAASIVLMFFPGQVDGLILVCLFLLLLSIGSEYSFLERYSANSAISVAIRYEYAVFLNHAFVIGMVKKLFVERFCFPNPVNLAVLLSSLVIYSVITETFVSKTAQLLHQKIKKVNA